MPKYAPGQPLRKRNIRLIQLGYSDRGLLATQMAGPSSESDSRVLLKEQDDLEDARPEDEVPVWVAPAGSTLAEASNYNSAHDLPHLELQAAALEATMPEPASPGRAERSRTLKALMYVGFSGVLFALQAACIKLAPQYEGGGTFEMVFARGLCQMSGVAVSNAWLWSRGEHPLPVRHWLGVNLYQAKWLLARAIVGFGGIGFGFASVQRLPLGDQSALNFTSPCVAVLIAWLTLGERAGRVELLGLGGALAGALLVARPPMLFGAADGGVLAPLDQLGVALALLGSVSAGSVVVIIRKLAQKLHWSVVLLWQALGQTLIAPLVAVAVGERFHAPGAPLLWLMAAGGGFAFFAQVLLTKGLAAEKVGPASAMRSTTVLCSFVLQAALTPSEPVQPLSVVGALVITGAIVLILLNKTRRKRSGGSSGGSGSGSRTAASVAAR